MCYSRWIFFYQQFTLPLFFAAVSAGGLIASSPYGYGSGYGSGYGHGYGYSAPLSYAHSAPLSYAHSAPLAYASHAAPLAYSHHASPYSYGHGGYSHAYSAPIVKAVAPVAYAAPVVKHVVPAATSYANTYKVSFKPTTENAICYTFRIFVTISWNVLTGKFCYFRFLKLIYFLSTFHKLSSRLTRTKKCLTFKMLIVRKKILWHKFRVLLYDKVKYIMHRFRQVSHSHPVVHHAVAAPIVHAAPAYHAPLAYTSHAAPYAAYHGAAYHGAGFHGASSYGSAIHHSAPLAYAAHSAPLAYSHGYGGGYGGAYGHSYIH